MTQSEVPGPPPTIVIVGLRGAGKTTFIRAISEPAGLISPVERTVDGRVLACELGRVTLRAASGVHLLALPDAPPEILVQALPDHTLGVVVLVDSTDETRLPDARQLLKAVAAAGQPCLVAATRGDQARALPLPYLRARLELPLLIPLVASDTMRPESVRAALIHLLHLVIEARGTGPLSD